MWRNLAMCAAGLTLAACGSSTEPKNSAVGNYTMIAYAEQPLPYGGSPTYDGGNGYLLGATLGIDATGHYLLVFRSTIQYPAAPPKNGADSQSGIWMQRGTALTLTQTSGTGGVITAQLRGDTIEDSGGSKYVRQ